MRRSRHRQIEHLRSSNLQCAVHFGHLISVSSTLHILTATFSAEKGIRDTLLLQVQPPEPPSTSYSPLIRRLPCYPQPSGRRTRRPRARRKPIHRHSHHRGLRRFSGYEALTRQQAGQSSGQRTWSTMRGLARNSRRVRSTPKQALLVQFELSADVMTP